MCGILGLYDSLGIKKTAFSKAFSHLEKRGPDHQAITEINKNLSFGHTRLSIIDLDQRSNQPFVIDNQYYLTYNGEIFNYKELRSKLEKSGHIFKSNGDTEVVLRSYMEWGADCVKKFNGMWAFAIYDKVQNKLFCSRDRYGVKPFYYYHDKGKFMFSSMIKPLIDYYTNLRKPNYSSITEFLYRGNISASQETWFKNIQKLLPGNSILYDFKSLNSRSLP